MRATLPLALALLSGCEAFDPDPELRAFADCDDMREYMKHMAMEEARYDWAFEFGIGGLVAQDYALTAAPEDAGSADSDDGGASSYSTTNLQEAGVDESDLVKTDGTYLYSVAGDTLVISKAWPVEEAEVVATVRIDGAVEGLYLDGDTVVVLSRIDPWSAAPSPRSRVAPDREEPMTLATVVDVTDRSAPEVVRETYATGTLDESRKIGSRLFVVTYQDLSIAPEAEDFGEIKAAIKDAEPTAWLPWRFDNVLSGGAWRTDAKEACDCEQVYASDREGGTYLTNVLSLDLGDPLSDFEGEAVVGRADTVYASESSIYVAYGEVDDGAFPTVDDALDTIVHKFDIATGVAHPEYRATAKVQGSLIDQFALSERDGVLRMAMDDGDASAVVTLREEGGDFDQLDRVGDLAPGEQIMSARFAGRVGYLVTTVWEESEWNDPLFTVDLADPADIRVTGELEISGWSDYLHPMDDDHLLAIGMDSDDDGELQLAISLFDVSDMDAPALVDRAVLPAWSSEAQEEHHAFNWFPEQQVLVVPSQTEEWTSVLEVIHADTSGLEPVGRVSQATVEAAAGETWCGQIRRSVIMEDKVWAVSSIGLTAAALAVPEEELAAVPFTGVEPCGTEVW